jgi:ribosomal subunit interface protein
VEVGMQVSITARHCTVPETVRRHADERVRRLSRYDARLTSADVVFEADHGSKQAELRLFVAGQSVLVASGAGETFRAGIDRALERARRRLRRNRERRRDHQAVKLAELPLTAGEM